MTTHRVPPLSPGASPSADLADFAHASDDTGWHALADGRLAPSEAASLGAQLQNDATALETIAYWQKQRKLLQALHTEMLDAPVPDMLMSAALRTADRKMQQMQWWRWGGMAASVLVAFVLGWAGHGQWSGSTSHLASAKQPTDGANMLTAAPAQRFAEQAAVAHAVYQPEVRHPVEVGAAQQDHLVQWLSKRLDRPLKVPVLSPLGYELVGGRLLPGDTGARAQFMYQNGAGQRITLYMGALAGSTPATNGVSGASGGNSTHAHSHTTTAPSPASPGVPTQSSSLPRSSPAEPMPAAASATTFQFTNEGPVPGFYWVDAGFGYALSGQLSRAQLLALATAVYPQIQP